MIGYIATFHVSVTFLTQLLHIFNYPVIIVMNLAFIATFYYFFGRARDTEFYRHLYKNLHKNSFSFIKENWFLLATLIVVVFQLLSIRFNYTGPVQTMRGPAQVENSSYVYPYFSDEWVNVSLIKYSITNHVLPVANPLFHDQISPNILFIFTGTISEFFLITGLNPLTSYFILQLFIVLAICLSLYILLQLWGVHKYISAVSMLGLMYITNSGNLPAMWSLLPVTLSILFLLWSIISQKESQRMWVMIYGVLSLVVYPPMIVFVLPILCLELHRIYKQNNKEYLKYLAQISGIGVGTFVLIFSVAFFHFHLSVWQVINHYFIRPNLDPGIPDYALWNVLPLLIVLISLYGIYISYKKKYLEILIPFYIGVAYWLMYVFVNKVFIIEYPRIALITSIFFIVLAGIGLEHLVKESINKEYFVSKKKNIHQYVSICLLVFCVLLLPSYAKQTGWQNINLRMYDSKGDVHLVLPANPINRYMEGDDLNIFKDIHEVNFLSIPWKALVVGAATHNFPLESKSSTITNQVYPFSTFMKLDCVEKAEAANKYDIKYIYSGQFSCPKFSEIAKSKEGFSLYQFIP